MSGLDTFAELLARPQFSIPQADKEAMLAAELEEMTARHRAACPAYDRVVSLTAGPSGPGLAGLAYLPVGLFKSHRLVSVPDEEIFKTLTSSGTTGQQPSRIYLDRVTAERQTRALTAIMTRVLGPKRLPMLIVDHPGVLKDRLSFSARGAGILGMMGFGRSHSYLLDDRMRLDRDALRAFLEKFSGQPILLFGFTFMVWKYLYSQLDGIDVDLSQAVLIHSGGWKTLTDEAVDNERFKQALLDATGLARVHNFYGMVEQVGSVLLEGPDGYLYPPNFGDVIIRDPTDWSEAPDGTPGVIQVLSVLPHSYPGHSILTEDLGVVEGTGTAESGWAGKRLRVLGRVPRAELRGCSDTHAADALSGRP